MAKCKVCGADAGFMGVICSPCSTERASELHHYKAQPNPAPDSDGATSNSSELLRAAIYAMNSEGDEDRGLSIARQILEYYPYSPEAVKAQTMIDKIAPSSAIKSSGLEQTDECLTENPTLNREVNDSEERAGSKTRKIGCGILLVLALIGGFGIWALAEVACALLAIFLGFSECPQDLFAHIF